MKELQRRRRRISLPTKTFAGETLFVRAGGFAYSTVTNSRNARKRRSLIPRTTIKCSARRNAPNCSRCAMMRAARLTPMPGSFSSSARAAVLILMRGAIWLDEKLFSGVKADKTAVCRFILTQDEADSTAQSASDNNARACLIENLCVMHAKRCRRTG